MPVAMSRWHSVVAVVALWCHVCLLHGAEEAYRMLMPNLTRQWTAAERDELPDDGNRYEVIDGDLFVTPAPSLIHKRFC